MSNRELDLGARIQALTPLHQSIKTICESVDLDVQAAERFAKKSGLFLPWHDEVTPQGSLESAREILLTKPGTVSNASDVVSYFVQSYTQSKAPVGLIGALAVTNNQFWDAPEKAGFLAHFPQQVYQEFTEWTRDPHLPVNPDGVCGALCWLVHDVLAAEALQKTRLRNEDSQVIDILLKYTVISLIEVAQGEARHGTDQCPIINKLDEVLTTFGSKYSAARGRISDLYSIYMQESATQLDSEPSCLRLLADLERVFPDPLQVLARSSLKISGESTEAVEIYRAAQALTNFLKDPLVSRPEWADPLGVAADEIKSKELVNLFFNGADLLTSSRAREVLCDLLSRVPGVKLVLSVDQLLSRKPNDPQYEDLAKDVNYLISTNIPSYLINTTSQPDFEIRVAQMIGFLHEVGDRIGRKNIKIIAPQEVSSVSVDSGAPVCLISGPASPLHLGEPVPFTWSKIGISLRPPKQDDGVVARLRRVIDEGLGSQLASECIWSAIMSVVVPNLAQQDLPRDQHGLNGLRVVEVAPELSQVRIEGLGLFPTISRKLYEETGYLRIVYTGRYDDPEEEQPVDAEDTPLQDDLSDAGDLVGSKRS